jgi:hypothetical protein
MTTLCEDNRETLIRKVQAALQARALEFTCEQLVLLLPAATPADFGAWLLGQCPDVGHLRASDLDRIYMEFHRLLRARLSLIPIPHGSLGVA